VKPYKQAEDLSDRKGMFVEKYFIDGDRLRCQAGTEVVDLADGVRGIHFAFGVGKFSADRNKERKIDAFVTTLPSTKEAIRALRYSVLLVSSQPNVTGGVESSICTRWTKATGNQTACSANDGRLYQIASKALTLRNQMP
jgi:tfp pilus assembly protein pilW-like protein